MQKDLYAPYPSNLNRLLSVTHTRGGRAWRAGARRARRPSAAVVSTHLSRMNLRFLDPFS